MWRSVRHGHRSHRAREPRVPGQPRRLGGACRAAIAQAARARRRSCAFPSATCRAIAGSATCRRRPMPRSSSARGPRSPRRPAAARRRRRARHRAHRRRRAVYATALVIDRDGTRLGFQDKVQIDPSRGGHVHARRRRAPRVRRRRADVRRRDLSRGLALSRDRALGRAAAARRSCSIPHFARGRARRLRPTTFARSREHVPREGDAVPRRREHLLLRERELRERGLADDVGDRAARRHAARRTSRTARRACSWPRSIFRPRP